METWKLVGARGVADFCFVLFSCFHIERALAFYWRGASAALLQKGHFCFAMPSFVDQNSEF
jgi:hypothetical protein